MEAPTSEVISPLSCRCDVSMTVVETFPPLLSRHMEHGNMAPEHACILLSKGGTFIVEKPNGG